MGKNLRILIMACGVLYGINFLFDYFKGKMNPDKILENIATEQNKTLPKTLNAQLRWDNAVAEPNLTYRNNFTITNPQAKMISPSQFEQAFRQTNKLSELCNQPNLKNFWKLDGKIKLSLSAEDKTPLYDFLITANDCKPFLKQ